MATAGPNVITLPEYESQYLKNSPNRDSAAALTMADRQKFLDLMINYRLKLDEAKASRLEQRPEVSQEIEQYKGEFVSSYIAERELITPAIQKMYDRRGEEIRLSHIIFILNGSSSHIDSANAFAKAHAVMDSLARGHSFDSLARTNSMDPSAPENGGDLYFITGGQLVPEFEDSVFAIPVGQTRIVPSRFGIHVVKVTARQPLREIRISHIMIRVKSFANPADTLEAYQKISAIKDSLAMGRPFAELARNNSGDRGSAPAGGDLGWSRRRKYPISFEEAAFSLKPGQTSGIVRTSVGYHLILCLGERGRGGFDELKNELQTTYQRTRFNDERKQLAERIARTIGLRYDTTAIMAFRAQCDSTLSTLSPGWADGLKPAQGKAIVLAAKGNAMTLDSLVSALSHPQENRGVPLRATGFREAVDRIRDQFAWHAAADSFCTVYPELASILKEYKEGVLLYQLEQDNVWSHINPTDSILQDVYAKNKSHFTWPDRIHITEFRTPDARTAALLEAKMKSGASIDQLVIDDSVRLAQQRIFVLTFAPHASTLTPQMRGQLVTAGKQLAADTLLKAVITITSDQGDAGAKEAGKRGEAIKSYLTQTFAIPAGHLNVVTRPVMNAEEKKDPKKRAAKTAAVELAINNRQAWFPAKPQASAFPAKDADERVRHADSLANGQLSAPFAWGGQYEFVRRDSLERSRVKTFDEAQVDVSGFYQESESKRLEAEWIQRLRTKSPVTTNPQVLQAAFGPEKK